MTKEVLTIDCDDWDALNLVVGRQTFTVRSELYFGRPTLLVEVKGDAYISGGLLENAVMVIAEPSRELGDQDE